MIDIVNARRLPRWLGIVAVGLIALAALASIGPLLAASSDGLILQGPAAVDPDIESELSVLFDPAAVLVIQRVLHLLGLLVFVGLAVLVMFRARVSRIAPVAAVTLAAVGVSLFAPLSKIPAGTTFVKVIGSINPDSLPRFWGSVAGLSLLAFMSVFPDGIWTPRWTRWFVYAAAAQGIGTVLLPMSFLDPASWPSELQALWLVALPGSVVGAQLIRWRAVGFAPATRPVVISLIATLVAFVLLWAIQPELSPGTLELVVVTPRLRAVYALNLLVLLSLAVFLFPVAVSFSIVRYRLFDVDLLVNRAIVYGAATGLVGASFLLLAFLVSSLANGRLSSTVTGRLAVPAGIALGVAVVLVFQPMRRRVQRAVDRRFYRERYDAQQIIDRFTSEMTRVVSPDQLEIGLIDVITAAVLPRTVHLHTGPFTDLVSSVLGRGGAIDTANLEDGALPEPFTPTRSGVLVPLLAGGVLTGVVELGERSSGSRYSKLDLNLLDRMARTAGPALQLAHEVAMREKTAKDKERAANELDLARKIQQGLLPKEFPELEGWSFDAFYKPAREVGGDFYDWIGLADGRLGVVIGDVSDKGIPAALVMATCRALLRSTAGNGLSPGGLLAEVNNRIQPDIPSGMFVTCLVAFLDPRTGEVEMANAGHNLPFLCDSGGTDQIMVRGMPLGLIPDMDYEEVATVIPVAGSLVLSSDGIAESHDPAGEMFGTQRLAEVLSGEDEYVVDVALNQLRDFVGSDWEQEDDITLVTVRRSPAVDKSSNHPGTHPILDGQLSPVRF